MRQEKAEEVQERRFLEGMDGPSLAEPAITEANSPSGNKLMRSQNGIF